MQEQVNWNNKDKRVAYESILRTLIGTNGIWGKTLKEVNKMRDQTVDEVDFLFDQYPTTPEEVIHPNATIPAKTYASAPKTNDQYQGSDISGQTCLQCGQGMIVRKSGTSKKTGKPYTMYACDNYPACKFVQN